MYPRDYFDTYWRPDLRNEVFVIMSFDPEFNPVWEQAIKPAIEEDLEGEFKAHRVDATQLVGSIVTDIMDGIAHSKLIFAEISICSRGKWKGQRNGNVMYEVGLSHALRQSTELVMVRTDDEPLNFDIAGIRVQKYSPDTLGETRKLFAAIMKACLKNMDQTKSLKVERAIMSLDADCLNLMRKYGQGDGFTFLRPSLLFLMRLRIPFLEYIISNPWAYGFNNPSERTRAAISKLLELGILFCHADVNDEYYTYYWTKFGVAVLEKIGFNFSYYMKMAKFKHGVEFIRLPPNFSFSEKEEKEPPKDSA